LYTEIDQRPIIVDSKFDFVFSDNHTFYVSNRCVLLANTGNINLANVLAVVY